MSALLAEDFLAPVACDVVTLRRSGAPPLRLRAALRARHGVRDGGAAAEITLWARMSVGWAVSVQVSEDAEGGGRTRMDAQAFESLAEAQHYVASLAGAVVRPASVKRGGKVDTAVAILCARVSAAQAGRALSRAAGAALADWGALDDEVGSAV